MWCGEKWRNGYWFMCGVASLCMCMINCSLPGSTDCLFSLLPSCRVMSSFCFFFLSLTPPSPTKKKNTFHIPASSLLATISPGLQLPSFPARSLWNPPRTINIVWEHSLGKHEPKRLISLKSHTFYLAMTAHVVTGPDTCDISFTVDYLCLLGDWCIFLCLTKPSVFMSSWTVIPDTDWLST